MSDWEPNEHSQDPMVNAVLNVAEQIGRLADATNRLRHSLAYGGDKGLSVAEALEVSAEKIAKSVECLVDSVEKLPAETADIACKIKEGLGDIVDALEERP